jgi:hypothetical protein
MSAQATVGNFTTVFRPLGPCRDCGGRVHHHFAAEDEPDPPWPSVRQHVGGYGWAADWRHEAGCPIAGERPVEPDVADSDSPGSLATAAERP